MAAKPFVDRLKKHGLPLPDFAARLEEYDELPQAPSQTQPAKLVYDGVTRIVTVAKPRIGAQRGPILLCVAKATKEGRSITSREVSDETGEDYRRVVNVVWQDVARGILAYPDDFHPKIGFPKPVIMTELGFEILRKAGLLESPSKE
jgi:hypothetical protein